MIGSRAIRRAAALLSVAVVGSLLLVPSVHAADSRPAQTYLVVFKARSLPANASSLIGSAGGTLTYSYPQIGVVVAQSSSSTFRSSLMRTNKIQGAAATAGFATHVDDGALATDTAPTLTLDTPVSDTDQLS